MQRPWPRCSRTARRTRLDDPRWSARLAQPTKLAHYAGPASGQAEMIAASQRVQAAALQYGIEVCRLRREPRLLCRKCNSTLRRRGILAVQ